MKEVAKERIASGGAVLTSYRLKVVLYSAGGPPNRDNSQDRENRAHGPPRALPGPFSGIVAYRGNVKYLGLCYIFWGIVAYWVLA